MNFSSSSAVLPSSTRWWPIILALAVAGCGQDKIRVYQVPKERPVRSAGAHDHSHAHAHGSEAAMPHLEWKTPAGWEEVKPGEMRVASFQIKKDGKIADVGIVPLPGLAGGDLGNVNRWRAQVGLDPVKEEDLEKLAENVEVAGATGKLFEQAGENPSSGEATRVLASVLHREGVAWFIKMTGDDALVAEHKPAFIEFLKSLKFVEGHPELPPSHPPIDGMRASAGPAPAAAEGKPTWQPPAHWQEVAGGSFLVAKFTITGEGGQAAVNVSTSAGDGGGLAGNVNRWRKQVGLDELPEAEIRKSVKELADGKGSLVEMSGTDARTGQKASVVGVIVPQANQTWFYKLMGDEKVVEREKASFTKFVETAKYPNAS